MVLPNLSCGSYEPGWMSEVTGLISASRTGMSLDTMRSGMPPSRSRCIKYAFRISNTHVGMSTMRTPPASSMSKSAASIGRSG